MKEQDFTCSITANVTAQAAANAINQVSAWWAKTVEGNPQKQDDVFTVKFGETWVTFKITELIPAERIVWTVTDCYLPWLEDKTEWKGTKTIFQISTTGNLTAINFIHHGLTPQVECYDQCVKGWTGHITGSLLNLLNTGVGQPA